MEDIKKAVPAAVEALIEEAALSAGEILVIGCSTSEVAGEKIGKGSVYALGEAIIEAALSVPLPRGIYLAAGCCEHLNRAVILLRAAAEFSAICKFPIKKEVKFYLTLKKRCDILV